MKKVLSKITICSLKQFDTIDGRYGIEVVAKDNKRAESFKAIEDDPYSCLLAIEFKIMEEFGEYFSFGQSKDFKSFSYN